MLHYNRPLFEQAVIQTSNETGIDPSIIEKDYYVTLFLKELSDKEPKIVFKGGTSLSKCFNLIKRFSEDIDLNLLSDKALAPTEGERKRFKELIEDTASSYGLRLMNPEEIGSKKKFNRYRFEYESLFDSTFLKQHLIVETATLIRSFPVVRMKASSYLYFYLKSHGFDRIIEEYHLEPFAINVQSAERTLLDKAYALGDYYLSEDITEHSRHLYDILKLLDMVKLDEHLIALFHEVRAERKTNKTCLSAQDNQSLADLLQHIINEGTFKQDYDLITKSLLFEDVSYDQTIVGLKKLISFLSQM